MFIEFGSIVICLESIIMFRKRENIIQIYITDNTIVEVKFDTDIKAFECYYSIRDIKENIYFDIKDFDIISKVVLHKPF